MSEKTEYVEVTLKIPKGLIDFLEDMKACFDCSVKEHLEITLLDSIKAQIEADFIFAPTVESVVEKYHLEGVFRDP